MNREELGHGASRYSNYKCRCQECREAWSSYIQKRREQRVAYVRANGLPDSVAHGASAYGNWGCRCVVCTKAHSAKRVADARARRRRGGA